MVFQGNAVQKEEDKVKVNKSDNEEEEEYDQHDSNYYYHYRRVLFLGIHKSNFRSTSRDLSCDQNLFDEEISILYNFESILRFPVV